MPKLPKKSQKISKVYNVPEFEKVGREITFKYKLRPHYEAPQMWELNVVVSSTNGQPFGTAECIIYAGFRENFHYNMDIHSEETALLSTEIFTQHGTILPELLTDPGKGSGVWGKEINIGGFIIIETIRVVKEHRKLGIGRWILSQIFQIPEISFECEFAYAWPTVLNHDNDCPDSEREGRCALILRFFHLAGFRRVGRTVFLGYAIHNNAAHPSRQLPMEMDPPEMNKNPFQNLPQEELISKFPLHAVIQQKSDSEAVAYLRSPAAAASISTPDPMGNTPLHLAASAGKIQVVRTILATVGPSAATVVNKEGRTPLAQLEKELIASRNSFNAMPAKLEWKGYDKNKCMILLELHNAMGKPVPAVQPPKEPWMGFQWGCTCGTCKEGWFSQRMGYLLGSCAAELTQYVKDSYSEYRHDNKKIFPEDKYGLEFSMASYIPYEIRKRGLYPTFLAGYALVFRTIAVVISDGKIPSKENVLKDISSPEIPPKFTSPYFSQGGKIEHALYGVVSHSSEDMESVQALEELMEQFPKCENDCAFAMVCDRLGLPRDKILYSTNPYAGGIDNFADSLNRLSKQDIEEIHHGKQVPEIRKSYACAVCKAEGPWKVCGGCGMVYYCSVDHQKQAWKTHKPFCKKDAKK